MITVEVSANSKVSFPPQMCVFTKVRLTTRARSGRMAARTPVCAWTPQLDATCVQTG